MAIDNGASPVDVDDSAAVVIAAVGGDGSTNVLAQNQGPDSCWIGGAGVTDADGVELPVGEDLAAALSGGEQLFGRCAAGETAEIRVLRTGV